MEYSKRLLFFLMIFSLLPGWPVATPLVPQAQAASPSEIVESVSTLKDAMAGALDYNPSVAAEQTALEALASAKKETRALLLPSLNLTSDLGYERVHNSLTRTRQLNGDDSHDYRDLGYNAQSATLSQLLYDGNLSYRRYKTSHFEMAAGRHLAELAAEDTAFLTASAYMEIIRNQEIISHAQTYIHGLRVLEKKIQQRVETGNSTTTDLSRVGLAISDAEKLIIDYESFLASAEDRFTAITGRRPVDLIKPSPVDKLLPASPDEALNILMEENPEFLMSQAVINQREQELSAAKAAFHPRVDVMVQGSREENVDAVEDVDYTVAGLFRVSFNMLRGGGDLAGMRRAGHRLTESRQRSDQVRIDLENQVKDQFITLDSQNKKIPLLRNKITHAGKILEDYQLQFIINARDILDVLDMHKMIFNFEAELATEEAAKFVSACRVLMLTGRLLKSMEINPAIPAG